MFRWKDAYRNNIEKRHLPMCINKERQTRNFRSASLITITLCLSGATGRLRFSFVQTPSSSPSDLKSARLCGKERRFASPP